jgi:hypothetical protein
MIKIAITVEAFEAICATLPLGSVRAVEADPTGGQQHDLRPPDVLLRRVAVLNLGFEPTNIDGRNGERFSSAHRADSHDAHAVGIPLGIQMSGSIH